MLLYFLRVGGISRKAASITQTALTYNAFFDFLSASLIVIVSDDLKKTGPCTLMVSGRDS